MGPCLALNRRELLAASAGAAALAAMPPGLASALAAESPAKRNAITTRDGTRLFYKDWGDGPAIVLSHGWLLSADAWDGQLMGLAAAGFRVIAPDRRSHGRSGQTFGGNDMDHFADDLEDLLAALRIENALLVGHSMGGGEVARYIGRHGPGRVAKVALVAPVTPLLLQSSANPGGVPQSAFDGMRTGLRSNRSQFARDFALPFYGYGRPGVPTSEGRVDDFWRQAMQGGIEGQYDCVAAFSEVDFTPDLKAMTMPVLLLHGTEDALVPLPITSERVAAIVPQAKLVLYDGAPHALPISHRDRLNADLVRFARS